MKIYVRMICGLGNQMFIYAFARLLELKYEANDILLDLRGYKKYKVRNFEMNNFVLSETVKCMDNTKIMIKGDSSRLIFHLFRGIYNRIIRKYLDFPSYCLSKIGLFYSDMTVKKIPEKMNKKIYMFMDIFNRLHY